LHQAKSKFQFYLKCKHYVKVFVLEKIFEEGRKALQLPNRLFKKHNILRHKQHETFLSIPNRNIFVINGRLVRLADVIWSGKAVKTQTLT